MRKQATDLWETSIHFGCVSACGVRGHQRCVVGGPSIVFARVCGEAKKKKKAKACGFGPTRREQKTERAKKLKNKIKNSHTTRLFPSSSTGAHMCANPLLHVLERFFSLEREMRQYL